MRELFVYYRVRPENAAAARAAVCDLHARLRVAMPRLKARLLCREDGPADLQTWMETYAAADGVSDDAQARIEALAQVVLPWIDGPRHTEVFVACAS